MSTGRSEDEAWRAIIDNYGERARLEEAAPEAQPAREPSSDDLHPVAHDPAPEPEEPGERFVPPVPPPAPPLPLPRRLAWLGVIGSPVVLVLALLFSFTVPSMLGYALLAAFLGGFAYLVATMERAESRDPWDDGAQI